MLTFHSHDKAGGRSEKNKPQFPSAPSNDSPLLASIPKKLLPYSSMAEQTAVNRNVVGSSPTGAVFYPLPSLTTY
ncbi:MAG: hypothetical protein RLZZ148_2127 [Cyanobacteriota bacterium]